jgi:8-oxo-dGTP pyrophosphatase MutT (NUDIX family)
MKELLQQLLASRQKQEFADTNAVPAAVLVPIFFKEGQCHILFTKRTEHVPKHHGEISFPGGAFESYDGSLLKTALRESKEEIGLPEADIEVLGSLSDSPTMVSGYVIHPFIGVIPYPHALTLDPFETEAVIEAPVLELMDTSRFHEEIRVKEGKSWKVYFYHFEDKVIWGATANILRQFLSVFNEAMACERTFSAQIVPLPKLP